MLVFSVGPTFFLGFTIPQPLRETPCLPCAQSTRQSPKNTRQRLCRVPHTSKATRQTAVGKGSLSRVQYFEHTAKPLPCAESDPRQNFVHDRLDDVARDFAMCFPGLAHGKGRIFAMCHGNSIRQRMFCRVLCCSTRQTLNFIVCFLFAVCYVGGRTTTSHI